MEEKTVRQYLKDKTHISVPELQNELGVGYGKAKKMMQSLIRKSLAEENPQGITYRLNFWTLTPRTLSVREHWELTQSLTDQELAVLVRLSDEEKTPDELKDFSEELGRLEQRNLIHRFRSFYFLSLAPESMMRLKEDMYEDVSKITLAQIGYPILTSCIEADETPGELLELEFMPKECKAYITKGLERYGRTQMKPKRARENERFRRSNALKYEILETFVCNCKFATKEEYDEAARKNAEIIQNSPHCSKAFKEAAREAAREIEKELTLSNLMEIRKIIQSDEQDEE